ncbi:tryptophan synthase subunit alpha [Rickettsiales bacterium]|nr:tryptophan synthase subunit alpha [Rickettsiales bacterium]
MTLRIKNKFEDLKKQGRAGLITFTMAYDPDLEKSLEIFKSLPESGADIIEIGMPFSDPSADGVAIQEAGKRALKSGAKLAGVLGMVAEFRKGDNETPIIIMGYYNPIQHYGCDKFLKDAKKSGVDGLIIVDLPLEEDKEFFALAESENISLIKLITPTTNSERLEKILKRASGFLYYVSVAGITGQKSATTESVKKSIDMIKKHTDLPVAVGFGIKDAKSASEMSKVADAIIVGSALVKCVEKNDDSVLSLVKALRDAISVN